MFSFKNLGHYVAVVARDIVKFGSAVRAAEPAIEGITQLIYPPAVVVERAASSALGIVIDAADKAAPVAEGGLQTLSIQVLSDEVNDFKALAAFFKKHGAANGVSFPQLPPAPPASIAGSPAK